MMTINISEILSAPSVSRTYTVCPGFERLKLKRQSYPVSHKEDFLLQVEKREDGSLTVAGETEIRILMPCDRCLDEVEMTFPVHIDRKIPPASSEDTDEAPDKDELSFLDGCMLDVDKLVCDEVVVALPSKVLCREDCKGLCSTCGANLNHETCSCGHETSDLRMAAIQDIFREFNQGK